MFVTDQQLEQQMPDATRLLSDEPELEAERQLAAEREKSQLLAEHLRSLGVEPESLV
ncbi:hypothetical protein [Anabaena lutea]|uniref:Uncharacterized protein n=1 Tax=Anabaena lutea FACHB-196 TaxID=2692881 RepID=A0ABR8FDF3_9NOST|nr:hypothetical protein [Anabaena lutea]MBD2566696.1 hypothetical protein [Anabaena lutea FACHB-196]